MTVSQSCLKLAAAAGNALWNRQRARENDDILSSRDSSTSTGCSTRSLMSVSTDRPALRTNLPPRGIYAHPPLVQVTLALMRKGDAVEPASASVLGPDWRESTSRCFINALGDRRVCCDDHQFTFSWLGHDGSRYPRYETIRDGFLAAWRQWGQYTFADELHPKATPRISYDNRIPRGTVWQTPEDWSFFKLLPSTTSTLLGEAKNTHGATTFTLQDDPGKLAVRWTFLSQEQPVPVMDISLEYIGLETDQPEEFWEAFDRGRDRIVRAFPLLMSDPANRYWGLGEGE